MKIKKISYYFLLALFLLFGLQNPTNDNIFGILIAFFLFGFVLYSVSNANKLFILLMTSVAWIVFLYLKGFGPVIVFGTFLGLTLSFLLYKVKVGETLAVLVLILSFLIISWINSDSLRTVLTQDLSIFAYNNDAGVFLKTYYLIEQNENYYSALNTAQLGRFEQPIVNGDVWGWRLPTIFYIWKFLPTSNGLSIYLLYLTLASFLLLTSYKIGRRYLGARLAILPGYLLLPYLYYAARDQTFLQTEWWSVSIFVMAIYLYIIRKRFYSTVLLSLTVMIREVYIFPIGLIFIYLFLTRKKNLGIFLIPLIAFSILFIFHISQVNYYINVYGTLFSPRIVSNGLLFVQQTLAFASWEYLLFQFRPFLIFLIASLGGVLYIMRTKSKNEALLWTLAYLPFPIAFLRFGTLPFNDYWGIIYVPIVIILAPLSIGLLKK